MRENALQTKCIKWFKATYPNSLCINMHGDGWGNRGIPDLVCCIKGRFVSFELKVGENEPEPAQVIWKKRIENAGGLWFCPRSLIEFQTIVREFAK